MFVLSQEKRILYVEVTAIFKFFFFFSEKYVNVIVEGKAKLTAGLSVTGSEAYSVEAQLLHEIWKRRLYMKTAKLYA